MLRGRVGVRSAMAALIAMYATVSAVQAGAGVRASRSGSVVRLENGIACVEFDLRTGVYSARDLRTGVWGLRGARAMVEDIRSDDRAAVRTWTSSPIRDRVGAGRRLSILCKLPRRGDLIVDLDLYEARSFLAARAGVVNRGPARRVRDIRPLADARLFPDLKLTDIRTLDGEGGALTNRVRRGPECESRNNLVATAVVGGARRSVAMGALTYTDFMKTVRTSAGPTPSSGRVAALLRRAPGGTEIPAYIDCGAPGKPTFRVVSGTPYVWSGAEAAGGAHAASVLFGPREVVLEAHGLRSTRTHVLGFVWWDYDGNGRVERVLAELPGGRRIVLQGAAPLPRWRDYSRGPEERSIELPAEAITDGSVRIIFENAANVPNAVVSEAWIWSAYDPFVPKQTTAPNAPTGGPLWADLSATDPVGRMVGSGERYLPDDRFYIDFITPGPFASAEQYGLAVRAAQNARPNPYDFPTVCAWYVGLFGSAPRFAVPGHALYDIISAPGLVAEAEAIKRSGFLKGSRAAVRLVPDTYAANNEQGWWDDAHWRQFGHYAPPYETTAKFTAGVLSAGVLPFTYFQLAHDSADFLAAHPGWQLGGDRRRGIDYTLPGVQAHMRRVYANLRAAKMQGMMFDYCDEWWQGECVRGGFGDRRTTAAAAYLMPLRLARAGLGPTAHIHERALFAPGSDVSAGVVDSQRLAGDTSSIDAEMVSRGGLRWYKNRTIFAYDMDSKDLRFGWNGLGPAVAEADGRRMILTMAHTAASRLLLATSFRDLSPDALSDLSRTFPYPPILRSARPVDAFSTAGWPRVYVLPTAPGRFTVTLYNNTEPGAPAEIAAPLAGAEGSGALGVDRGSQYDVWDFWNESYVGRFSGAATLRQSLRPGEARVLVLQRVENRPVALASDIHVMQGWIETGGRAPQWSATAGEIRGTADTAGRRRSRIILAGGGMRCTGARAEGAVARVEPIDEARGIWRLTLEPSGDGPVAWRARFAR